MKFHHYGVPVQNQCEGEIHIPHLKMYVSGYGKNEYGIEKMRFEPDADFPEIVKLQPHLAFEVSNLSDNLRGKNVIIPPNSPSPGVLVAFIESDGVPVELMEIDRSIAEKGI